MAMLFYGRCSKYVFQHTARYLHRSSLQPPKSDNQRHSATDKTRTLNRASLVFVGRESAFEARQSVKRSIRNLWAVFIGCDDNIVQFDPNEFIDILPMTAHFSPICYLSLSSPSQPPFVRSIKLHSPKSSKGCKYEQSRSDRSSTQLFVDFSFSIFHLPFRHGGRLYSVFLHCYFSITHCQFGKCFLSLGSFLDPKGENSSRNEEQWNDMNGGRMNRGQTRLS